ncbi:MAG: VacJ family lipoprotein [Desulfobacterales bacterium]
MGKDARQNNPALRAAMVLLRRSGRTTPSSGDATGAGVADRACRHPQRPIFLKRSKSRTIAWAAARALVIAMLLSSAPVRAANNVSGSAAAAPGTSSAPDQTHQTDQTDQTGPGEPVEASAPAIDDEFNFPSEEAQPAVRIADPFEPVNRVVFRFNDRLYFWVLKPVAKGYSRVFREDIRQCVANFFSNVLTPVRLANCLLQGKFKAAGTETARFFINTTMGVLGFGDAGKEMFNLEISDEDLGQTLGVYGIGNGFFIVWPLLGPSTVRDTAGFGGDLFLNPLTYLEPTGLALAVGGYRRLNDLSFRLGEYEAILAAAIEPYTAVRDGYIQFRKALVAQ